MGRQPLNFDQVDTAGDDLPRVVTMVYLAGTPVATYPITNGGFFAADTGRGGAMDSRLKAAFVEFLRVRHGGSGYLFAFGAGAVGTPNRTLNLPDNLRVAAERPFRSLSFPDINATAMRPAALPPSAFSSPPGTAVPLPAHQPAPFVWNPGEYLYFFSASSPGQPPPIPARRLFQVPDHYAGISPSNASERGDPFANSQTTDGNLGPLTGGRVNLVVPSERHVYLGSGAPPDRRQSPCSHRVAPRCDEPDHGPDPPVRCLDHDRVLRGQTARRPGAGGIEPDPGLRSARQGDRDARRPARSPLRLFVLDRSRAGGLNPEATGCIRDVVIYRNLIQ